MCLSATFWRVSLSGGQPTGKIAETMDLRSNEVASARRKICTSWPASASTSPCANGNAALVGSSDPQALFIMIFSFLDGDCAGDALQAVNGRLASRERRSRRNTFPPIERSGMNLGECIPSSAQVAKLESQ